MSDIVVTFACGHVMPVAARSEWLPQCACGNRQVARVKARAPRFMGTCTGPYAETKALAAGTVNVAPAGPLTLKPQE